MSRVCSIGKQKKKDECVVWFKKLPKGRNKQATVVKEVFLEVGIKRKINHSLRATGITKIFESVMPDKVIQQHSG